MLSLPAARTTALVLYISAVHILALLKSLRCEFIALSYSCPTICPTISIYLLKDILGMSRFLTILNEVAINIDLHAFATHSCKYQECDCWVELLLCIKLYKKLPNCLAILFCIHGPI